jgi:hypothetical protein
VEGVRASLQALLAEWNKKENEAAAQNDQTK